MWRLQRVPRSGHPAWFQGLKLARATFIRAHASKAETRRIHFLVLPVIRMHVLAVGIRLPDLDHGIVNGLTVSLKHDQDEFHRFSRRPRAGHASDRTLASNACV